MGSSVTLDELMDRYRKFVASIDGYPFSIYDYDDDVSVRVQLEDLIEQMTPEIRAELKGLDDVFMAQTVVSRRSSAMGPWYDRLPISPGEEIATDILCGNVY